MKLNAEQTLLLNVYLGGMIQPVVREKALFLHSGSQFMFADFLLMIFCSYLLSCSPQGKTEDFNSRATIGPY